MESQEMNESPRSEQSVSGFTEEFHSRFEIIREIGKGEFSIVYAAREKLLDRAVAIKHLKYAEETNSPTKAARFVREAQIMSSLDHPNICKVYGYGEGKQGSNYIVMEFLQGNTLEELIKQQRTGLNRQQFSNIFLPVMQALIHAHSKNIIHRDIKPANIIIAKIDDDEIVKVLDFGISKHLSSDQNLTKSMHVCGTSYYMSPEQCSNKEVDQRSDIYSLACVMYEAIGGKPPFSGGTVAETMYKHLTENLPSLQGITTARQIPYQLTQAIMRGLHKDPAKRPQSMVEFMHLIQEGLRSKKYLTRKGTTVLERGTATILIGGILILATSYLAFNLGQQSKQKSESSIAADIKIHRKSFGLVKAHTLLMQATKLLELKNAKEALAILNSLIDQWDPSLNSLLPDVYSTMGLSYLELGNWELAEQNFLKAIRLSSKDFEGNLQLRKHLAYTYMKKGDLSKAEDYYVDAIKFAENYYKGEYTVLVADTYADYGLALSKSNPAKVGFTPLSGQ